MNDLFFIGFVCTSVIVFGYGLSAIYFNGDKVGGDCGHSFRVGGIVGFFSIKKRNVEFRIRYIFNRIKQGDFEFFDLYSPMHFEIIDGASLYYGIKKENRCPGIKYARWDSACGLPCTMDILWPDEIDKDT